MVGVRTDPGGKNGYPKPEIAIDLPTLGFDANSWPAPMP